MMQVDLKKINSPEELRNIKITSEKQIRDWQAAIEREKQQYIEQVKARYKELQGIVSGEGSKLNKTEKIIKLYHAKKSREEIATQVDTSISNVNKVISLYNKGDKGEIRETKGEETALLVFEYLKANFKPQQIAEMTGLGISTVYKIQKELVILGYLQRSLDPVKIAEMVKVDVSYVLKVKEKYQWWKDRKNPVLRGKKQEERNKRFKEQRESKQ